MGRLCNMAQVLPELKAALHGGYAVTKATWHAGGRRRRLPKMALRVGSACERNWSELITLATELVDGNEGVPLAAERDFPPRSAAGALTVVTDASGEDANSRTFLLLLIFVVYVLYGRICVLVVAVCC